MDNHFEHNPLDFVGVVDANNVYVGIADRAAFDLIAAPCVDHGEQQNGHVLTKKIGNFGADEVTVVFQHWLKSTAGYAVQRKVDR